MIRPRTAASWLLVALLVVVAVAVATCTPISTRPVSAGVGAAVEAVGGAL